MTLPILIEDNKKFIPNMPFIFYTFPLEVLSLDEDFITSGALDDINDVRRPEWRDNPKILSYRGTFTMMGQLGVSTQWGVRNVATTKLWEYLVTKFGMKDGDYYTITNALPTFSETLGLTTFAKAVMLAKKAIKEQMTNGAAL